MAPMHSMISALRNDISLATLMPFKNVQLVLTEVIYPVTQTLKPGSWLPNRHPVVADSKLRYWVVADRRSVLLKALLPRREFEYRHSAIRGVCSELATAMFSDVTRLTNPEIGTYIDRHSKPVLPVFAFDRIAGYGTPMSFDWLN